MASLSKARGRARSPLRAVTNDMHGGGQRTARPTGMDAGVAPSAPFLVPMDAYYRTTSKAKPLRYSVSGIIGMMGWSGDCE